MINAYAALEAGAPLTPYSYDPGPLKPDEVELAVKYCGVCHSDLSIIDNEWGISKFPVVPGHEVVGEIVAVGDQVATLQAGQIAGLGWHSGYCNRCVSCGSGDHNLCRAAQPTIVRHHGGFADKVRAKANSVVVIPTGMDLASAGPLFCGGVTVFNPILELNIKPTDQVAVIGIGGLGHLALKFLRAWGCEVTAFTSSEAKKLEAMEMGAHHTLDSRDEMAIRSATGRFDLVLSTVAVSLDWNQYLNTLKPRGKLHFVGATTEPLGVNVFTLMAAQRSISSSTVGSPATIARMLEFALRHKITPQVEEFAMADVNAALDHLRAGEARYRVVLANPR